MPKPIVTLARFAVALDELGKSYLNQGPDDMKGLCLNVASLDGGIAFNVIPESATLTFSVRPPPGFAQAPFEAKLKEIATSIDSTIQLKKETRTIQISKMNMDGRPCIMSQQWATDAI